MSTTLTRIATAMAGLGRRATMLGLVVALLAALIAAPALMLPTPADAVVATPQARGMTVTHAPGHARLSEFDVATSGLAQRASASASGRTGEHARTFGANVTAGLGCGVLSLICGGDDGDGGDEGDDGGLVDVIVGTGDPGDIGNVIGGISDIVNPFETIGSAVAKAAATAWTGAMLAVWSAGLLILRLVLTFADWFLTPDLRPNGPGREVYAFSLWAALGLAGIMVMIQLGLAAFKREGKSLARAVIGSAQFVLVCAVWFGYCVIIVAACGGITRGLMKALLKIDSWSEFDPLGDFSTTGLTDAVIATVLGFLGFSLVLAGIGHLLIYLARAAALMILTATGPIAAAGLVSDAGRAWFWKTLRWFHAAAFTPVLMVFVLGIGVRFADGALVGMGVNDPAQKALGTALPAAVIVLVAVFAPMSLFKMFAFVDPGTPSGASFRQGMAVQGGLHNLLGGGGSNTGSQASKSDSHGRSAGEAGAEDATAGRFAKSIGGRGAVGVGLAVGQQALSRGLGMVQSLGAKSTALMSDVTNQAGVGSSTFGPDFSNAADGNGSRNAPTRGNDQGAGGNDQGAGGEDGSDGDTSTPTPPAPVPEPPPQLPPGIRPQTTPTPPPPSAPPGADKPGDAKPPGRPTTAGGAPPSRPPGS